MGTPGYVYALINPSTPGLVKVGMTSRDPSLRVNELSSATGVATPFILVYKEHFLDCEEAEKYVHTILERQGVRVSTNREFFHGEVSDIIKAISLTPGKCHPGIGEQHDDEDDLLPPSSDELDDFVLDGYKPKTPDQEVYEEAERYYYGFQDTIQDFPEAFKLFKQAAKLGSSESYHMIGRIYAEGSGVRQDYSKALEYFKEAARRGLFCAYGRMAEIFNDNSHAENEAKSWKKFFEGLDKSPNSDFSCDQNEILVYQFLFFKASNPTVFSSSKIILRNGEENYKPVIYKLKSQALDACNRMYEMSVNSLGKDNIVTKKNKAALDWTISL